MPSNPIVLSSSSPLSADFSAGFVPIENLRLAHFAARPVALELTTQRAGMEGWFEDNPSIETIDALRQTADDRGIPFLSIFLPINLSPADEKLGLEVSNVNGWTDLASYLGISHVRANLVSGAPNSSFRGSDILEPVIRYMHSGDLQVSLSTSVLLAPTLREWLRDYNRTSPHPIGWDYWDAKQIGQWPDAPTGSVTVSGEELDANSLEALLTNIETLEPKPLLVVRV